MQNIMVESILMAFVIGGIVGAVSALHLSRRHGQAIDQHHPEAVPVRHSPPRRRH